MNEHESDVPSAEGARDLEQWARQLGRRAGERLDVEATAREVVERLRRQPDRRAGWTAPEWLRVAAALVLLLGVGVALQQTGTPSARASASYELEDLRELTTAELEQVLATLDRTLTIDESELEDVNLDGLTPAQLQSLLQALET